MSATDDDSVFSSLQQVAGVRYNRAVHNKDIIDTFLLRKARQKGIRLPTGGPPEEYKYLGAKVFTSTAGMSHNVVYIDVGSMYPSLLMSLNASPETVIGTQADLEASEYTEEDCVWGYIDTRPVKHLSSGESWRQYTGGGYKMVYDPHKSDTKWTCDEEGGPQYERLYFVDHDVQKGFLTECVEELIDLKNTYRGTSLYGSTKRVTNCFTDDTEILTPDGAVPVTAVEEGDTVYTFDTDTYECKETSVEWTADYPHYNDTVYRFSNEDIDLQVTPDHQMVYISKTGEVVKTSAEALAKELTSHGVRIPCASNTFDVKGATLTQDDVERYQTSGSVHCLNVGGDNTVLAGRDGNFNPVGQSIYGVLGFANERSSFRLFDWRIAEAITLCGRKMIEHSAQYVLKRLRDRGYTDAHVALGDTDGCGIAVPSAATRHEALSTIEEITEELNGPGYDELFADEFNVPADQHHGEIEVESYAPKVFIPADDSQSDYPHTDIGVKKRRIEWQTWDEDDGEIDDIDLVGLEAERSDVAPIIQKIQREFAQTLRMDDGNARGELYPRLRQLAQDIQMGDIALDRVCKRGGIGQDLSEYGTASRRASTFYRGCKYANQNIDGVTIQRGDKPRLVYIDDVRSRSSKESFSDEDDEIEDVRGDYPSTYTADTAEDGDPIDAVTVPDPSQLPESFIIDWERHWIKALKEPMKPLLDTRFGANAWSQVLHQHEQTGFDAFTAD